MFHYQYFLKYCCCELPQRPLNTKTFRDICTVADIVTTVCSWWISFIIIHHHQVIQLVRDPRGILASRIETFRDTYRLWRLWRATGRRPHNLDLGQINTVCEDFLRSVSTGLARPAWLRGRYMLLRWEWDNTCVWHLIQSVFTVYALVLSYDELLWSVIPHQQGCMSVRQQDNLNTVSWR